MNAETPEQPARCLPQVWKVIGETDHPASWGSQSDKDGEVVVRMEGVKCRKDSGHNYGLVCDQLDMLNE